MAYKVGERVSIEMHGMLGRSKRDWSELSEFERSAMGILIDERKEKQNG